MGRFAARAEPAALPVLGFASQSLDELAWLPLVLPATQSAGIGLIFSNKDVAWDDFMTWVGGRGWTAGARRVVFTFDPMFYRIGQAVSAVTLATLAGLSLLAWASLRRAGGVRPLGG